MHNQDLRGFARHMLSLWFLSRFLFGLQMVAIYLIEISVDFQMTSLRLKREILTRIDCHSTGSP
jgi:hypothetical protein